MDIGDEGMMCNAVCDALLELAQPSTVSELASHLKVKEDRVQHALDGLKQTGLVSQGGGRWFMAGQSEAFDENTNQKVFALEKEFGSMGMRSRSPDRGTDQKVFAPSKELGSMRMRSRSPERGAMCPEKCVPSPEEKLQGRPVGQKDSSYAVVPIIDKSIVSQSPKVYTVGSSNMEITTTKPLQCVRISDPDVQENAGKFDRILKFLASKNGGVEAKDISKNCNLGDSAKGANPLLYHLEKKQVVFSEQAPGSQKRIWKLGSKTPTGQEIVEWAAEKAGARKVTSGSSVTTKTSNELHLHNHTHYHQHTNIVQVGDKSTINLPQEFEEHKRVFERSAEEELK